MFQPDEDGVLARVSASNLRRGFACFVLYGLGVLLICLAILRPPAVGWAAFLIVFGSGVLILADRMRRATMRELLLTKDELRDDEGRILAHISQVQRVERGVFAMKPSNGFTLVLTQKAERAWQPGLWWRSGRRLGVGGVTASGPAKFMAERIAMLIINKGDG